MLAHPDDAEILCAGTLIKLADAGWEIHIATATAGDCGTTSRPAVQISNIRRAEARASAALIGATYHCLECRDGFICYDPPTLACAHTLMRSICPTILFTHAPRDYMVDHEETSRIARSASFAFGCRNISPSPIRIPDAAVPWLYYCDPIEGRDPLGQLVTPTTVIDITAEQTRKLKMLACHESQREWLRVHHGIDEYLEATRRHDALRGSLIGVAAAEAFVQHRGHGYPQNDVLAEMFGT